MKVDQAKRLKELERENAQLQKIVADERSMPACEDERQEDRPGA